MSGHSKWATIKHKKALLDSKRGKVFTKLLKEITVVARAGGGDPSANPRLRTLIEKAKQVNMPQENLQRAIKKGTGELQGQSYEAQTYEGYGPGGIALMLEVLTDNKNRVASELRHIFSRHGGRLGESGSVNWMFDYYGVIQVVADKTSEEQLMELVLDYEIINIEQEDNCFVMTTDPKALEKIRLILIKNGLEVKSMELEWLPKVRITLSNEEEMKAVEFLELLDELDDVQATYTNL